jgi:hypothetical protein
VALGETGEFRRAVGVPEKNLTDAEARLGVDYPPTMLGEALSRRKEYADAAPLLSAGREGLKQRAVSIPAQQKRCLTEAVERLVRHYEATGNKDEAARWLAELEKARAP